MPVNKSVWDKEIPVSESTISNVDGGVLKKLPSGTKIIGISPSGASYWARTAKIEARNANGEEDNYFLKVLQGDHGKKMVASEFQGMETLYKVVPELLAKPVGWGSYEETPDTHFIVSEFHKLSDGIPDVKIFPALVAELHKRGVSPDGKFGFPIETYGGHMSQKFPVSDTWEECFSYGLRNAFENEARTHGVDPECEMLEKRIVEEVIPRLLRPLEMGGRSIVPRLVHGDLWDGNASVDLVTGKPLIFDGTPMYAHNEYELAPWRCPRHRMTQAYIDEYVQHFDISEPVEEFDDRGALYSLRFDMTASSLYPGNLMHREIARETMRKLVAKFGGGHE